MKLKTIIIVLRMVLPILSVKAQWEKASDYPVMHTILPNIRLPKVLNWKDSTASLYDFGGKLVLIDFWNTHCSACIKHFKELDSIQREYGDRLQIIMSTRNSRQAVTKFLESWQKKNQIKLSMPFVVAHKHKTVLGFL